MRLGLVLCKGSKPASRRGEALWPNGYALQSPHEILATPSECLEVRVCERDGARIQSADGSGNGDSPEAQLMRNMVAAFAMYERALIRARTRAALAVKKARGERTGGVPYGFRAVNGTLQPDDAEARTLARARELRKEGRSLRGIAAGLLAEGHRPRNGGAWAIQTIRRMTG